MENAVGIDVESHFDLRFTTTSGGDAIETEVAEQFVVVEQRTLTLTDANVHGGLVVGRGREHLRFFRGDRGVALDHVRGPRALGLDRQRKRSDIQQQHVLDIAAQHAALDRRADGDYFVGVHTLVRFLAAEFACGFDDLRHAGHAADEHEFVDFR